MPAKSLLTVGGRTKKLCGCWRGHLWWRAAEDVFLEQRQKLMGRAWWPEGPQCERNIIVIIFSRTADPEWAFPWEAVELSCFIYKFRSHTVWAQSRLVEEYYSGFHLDVSWLLTWTTSFLTLLVTKFGIGGFSTPRNSLRHHLGVLFLHHFRCQL